MIVCLWPQPIKTKILSFLIVINLRLWSNIIDDARCHLDQTKKPHLILEFINNC